jgi:hypothetical protein
MAQGKYIPGNWWKPQLFFMTAQVNGSPVYFFFDAVVRAEHSQEMIITRHPVQDATNIADHAYRSPARLVLEIAMSDAVAQYMPLSSSQMSAPYTSDISKSKSAYRTFLDLEKQRAALQVTTRLNTYNNMIIQSLRPVEEQETLYALNCTMILEEILVAQIGTTTNMLIPLNPTQKGLQPTEAVSSAIGAKAIPLAVPPSQYTQYDNLWGNQFVDENSVGPSSTNLYGGSGYNMSN